MNYFQVTYRLKAIKKEIYELRSLPTIDIQSKIQTLKNINLLLREQNHLLLEKQNLTSIEYNQVFISRKVSTQINTKNSTGTGHETDSELEQETSCGSEERRNYETKELA